jgi:hypothetical protein
MKRKLKGKRTIRTITGAEFDEKFERGEDITPWLDLKHVTVVHRVNVDFPAWMVKRLDLEALKLNISRQAVIKMWIFERLEAGRRARK